MNDIKFCTAKIRPFPNDTELICSLVDHDVGVNHVANLKDYAFLGSSTEVFWYESDRRNFRGDWIPCRDEKCILPDKHSGTHVE